MGELGQAVSDPCVRETPTQHRGAPTGNPCLDRARALQRAHRISEYEDPLDDPHRFRVQIS